MTEVDKYHQQMLDILMKFPYKLDQGPTNLQDHVYMGGYRAADDVAKLKEISITHVLNCAAFRKYEFNPYPADSGIEHYMQFHADDHHSYDILGKHFNKAKEFLDECKQQGGKCLVHCAMGINRSGAICAAYIMLDQQMPLLEVIQLMKSKRGRVLANRGFQKELIKLAKDNGLLQ